MQGFTCFWALVVELDDALFAAIAIPCTKYPVSQEALVVAVVAAVVAVGVRLPLSLSALLVRCPSTPALSGSAHLRQAGIRFPHPGPGGSDQATCPDLPTLDGRAEIRHHPARAIGPSWVRIYVPRASWDQASPFIQPEPRSVSSNRVI